MKGGLLPTLKGLLVTFLWSSSYILIKIGLVELSPFFFAAVRYSLASMILFIANSAKRKHTLLNQQKLVLFVVIGFLGYTIAQGFQFVGLAILPAVTVTFLLNFTAFFVLLLGIFFLKEKPNKIQCLGFPLALLGAYVYFQETLAFTSPWGVLIVLLSGVAWACYMIIVRYLQRVREVTSINLTTMSMAFGALGLLVISFFVEGFQPITVETGAILLWLSIVNTAFAFYLWNNVLKSISAFRLSMIQNTMLVQIGLLSVVFLGEVITGNMVVGIIAVLSGVILAQIRVDE